MAEGARILARPELTLLLRLEPGDLIVLENGRALHGRSGFERSGHFFELST